MDSLLYLAVILGIAAVSYVYYRAVYLKKPAKKSPDAPHFTLKIETE